MISLTSLPRYMKVIQTLTKFDFSNFNKTQLCNLKCHKNKIKRQDVFLSRSLTWRHAADAVLELEVAAAKLRGKAFTAWLYRASQGEKKKGHEKWRSASTQQPERGRSTGSRPLRFACCCCLTSSFIQRRRVSHGLLPWVCFCFHLSVFHMWLTGKNKRENGSEGGRDRHHVTQTTGQI